MRISIKQLLVLIVLLFLLFGDFYNIKKQLYSSIKKLKNFLKKYRKKGN